MAIVGIRTWREWTSEAARILGRSVEFRPKRWDRVSCAVITIGMHSVPGKSSSSIRTSSKSGPSRRSDSLQGGWEGLVADEGLDLGDGPLV